MRQEKTQIEYVSVDNLKAYERNARTHSDEQVQQVAESIKEFGFTETAAGSLRIHSDGGMRQTSLFRSIWLSPMKGVCLSTPCAKVLP